MILSRGRRYIFIHIPKTGGTSLALALEARAMKDDILLGDTPKASKRRNKVKGVKAAGRLWKHSTLADISGLASEEEINTFFTFTLVRNPWDRLVSYYHWLREQSFDHPVVARAKATSFEGFLCDPGIQSSFMKNTAESYMRTLSGAEVCNAYIRLEHFDEDAQPLFGHLGFRLTLEHTNQSDRTSDFRGYYTDETAGIVAKICAQDIEKFGYQFE